MFGRFREWLRQRREVEHRKRLALDRALEAFVRARGTTPMAAHLLRLESDHAVVRVMHFTNHVPPDRAWYAVFDDGTIRELAFEEVSHIEGPWR